MQTTAVVSEVAAMVGASSTVEDGNSRRPENRFFQSFQWSSRFALQVLDGFASLYA